MRKLILMVVIATLATACVPTQYVKPNGSSTTFNRDKAQCTYEAKLNQPQDPWMWPDTVSSCLQARGWVALRGR